MQSGEQDVLLMLVASVKPRVMVEIGVNAGLTAAAVLRGVPSIERYYGVDIDDGYQFEIQAQEIERPNEPGALVRDDPRFQLCLRDRDVLPDEADCVFIDGDHGRNAVRQDSEWAAKIVRPGGIIIWHDYGNITVEVTDVLDDLHANGRKIQNVAGTWLAVEQR